MAAKLIDEVRHWLWPQERANEEDAPAKEASPAPAPYAFVIDDEDGICRFISMALAKLGVEADSFPTAGQAILALEHRVPAIIFLDIALNRSDAIDVIRGLGETQYRGMVQLMSGSNPSLLEDVRRIGTRHGLNLLPPLTKPFRTDAIRQVLAGARLDHETVARLDDVRVDSINLEEALANRWLELWYQPKIDLRSKTLAGAEGLIRCNHPTRGTLAPSSFLPEASAHSLLALTEFVVVTALREWDDFAGAGVMLHTAVNTGVGALGSLPLAALIREHRPRSERWPGIILEVTESDVVKDVALVHEIATQLRIYGATFAIDDFGEGYSSFARLRELPFAELKLDRSFVDNCANDARNAGICQAIIELAHHFGAIAVAEGLETAADLQAVHRKLYLPRAGNGEVVSPPLAPVADAKAGGHETILVVEDAATVRGMVVRMLKELGYRVLEAEDGQAALKILQASTEIDLLFTDMIMPNGLSGEDLLLRARAQRPDLKVLFTSGYSEHFIKARGSAQSGPLLGKPYRREKLASAVRDALDGRLN